VGCDNAAAYQPMVLASSLLYDPTGILQTKLSHRERHKARRIGLEAMPLDQHIEGRASITAPATWPR